MKKMPIVLKVSKDDPEVAYLYLPGHPKSQVSGVVKKQIRIAEVVENYIGPDLYLDINEDGITIGIEII